MSDDVIGRKDYYGNPITKGSKAFKIKFKDNNQIYLGVFLHYILS